MAKGKQRKVRVSERMQALMDGKIDIADLTDEELARGQLLSDAGDFRGRPSDVIPRKFYTAAVQEHRRRLEMKFAAEVQPSLDALKAIRDNPKAPADARFKSAVHLLERAVGKVPDKVEAQVEVKKWEEGLEDIFYEADDEADG